MASEPTRHSTVHACGDHHARITALGSYKMSLVGGQGLVLDFMIGHCAVLAEPASHVG